MEADKRGDPAATADVRSAQEGPRAPTSVVHLVQKLVEVLHGSELRADGPEVLHVIAEVPHGGAIQRADPHRLDVQVLEVIQLLQNSCKTMKSKIRNIYSSVLDSLWKTYGFSGVLILNSSDKR